MSSEEILQVKLAAGIMMVLDLDNSDTAARLGVTIDRSTKSHVWISGSMEGLVKFQEECRYRQSMASFDQPLSWARSAKVAEKAIAKQIAEWTRQS